MLKLMAGESDRRAEFRSAVGYCELGQKPKIFTGKVEGTITLGVKGKGGFGYDPIFSPNEGDGRTFAEMSTAEKNNFSHRARAIEAFLNWLEQRGKASR